MFALAERIGQDVETVAAWPYSKLQDWIAYDETRTMADLIRRSAIGAGMSESDLFGVIEMEQEQSGWVGIVKVGGKTR